MSDTKSGQNYGLVSHITGLLHNDEIEGMIVIIKGKDGGVEMRCTDSFPFMERLGALEAAKYDMLEIASEE